MDLFDPQKPLVALLPLYDDLDLKLMLRREGNKRYADVRCNLGSKKIEVNSVARCPIRHNLQYLHDLVIAQTRDIEKH